VWGIIGIWETGVCLEIRKCLEYIYRKGVWEMILKLKRSGECMKYWDGVGL